MRLRACKSHSSGVLSAGFLVDARVAGFTVFVVMTRRLGKYIQLDAIYLIMDVSCF